MFGKGKKPEPLKRIDSLIGAGTSVEGHLQFSGGLRIDGTVRGDVRGRGDEPTTLVLSEHAKVSGEVHVTHLVINGAVQGPVHATDYLELQAKARVTGDVHYRRLEMQAGAMVEGRLVPLGEPDLAAVVELRRGAAPD